MTKIIAIGNSSGVLIPKAQLAELGLKVGDTVDVNVTGQKQKSVRITPSESAELADWATSFIRDYRPALEVLSKK